jgi:hypothetical protein
MGFFALLLGRPHARGPNGLSILAYFSIRDHQLHWLGLLKAGKPCVYGKLRERNDKFVDA